MFSVTHLFHPLQGQQFVLVQVRPKWGEEQVYEPTSVKCA
jgi:Family of unknown function (DUF5372)